MCKTSDSEYAVLQQSEALVSALKYSCYNSILLGRSIEVTYTKRRTRNIPGNDDQIVGNIGQTTKTNPGYRQHLQSSSLLYFFCSLSRPKSEQHARAQPSPIMDGYGPHISDRGSGKRPAKTTEIRSERIEMKPSLEARQVFCLSLCRAVKVMKGVYRTIGGGGGSHGQRQRARCVW